MNLLGKLLWLKSKLLETLSSFSQFPKVRVVAVVPLVLADWSEQAQPTSQSSLWLQLFFDYLSTGGPNRGVLLVRRFAQFLGEAHALYWVSGCPMVTAVERKTVKALLWLQLRPVLCCSLKCVVLLRSFGKHIPPTEFLDAMLIGGSCSLFLCLWNTQPWPQLSHGFDYNLRSSSENMLAACNFRTVFERDFMHYGSSVISWLDTIQRCVPT